MLLPKLRTFLLGTAGSGKTHTLKLAIARVCEILGDDAVLICAHTGVAAFNVGGGAETINSLFKLGSSGDYEPLVGLSETELIDRLGKCCLLVIDEISMVGCCQFGGQSLRLEQAVRGHYKRQRRRRGAAALDALVAGGFGGAGVVIVGDFGQAPPIGDASLLSPTPTEKKAAARRLGNLARRCFADFDACFRLRRVHRQGGVCPFKDSTLRLRDGAMTLADHDLWRTHDIADPSCSPELKMQAENWTWLCAENASAGQGLARCMLRLAQSSGQVVIRINAEHSDAAAARRPPDEFRGLRTQVHLVVGAPVMLLVNILYDVRGVLMGLMNGARGKVVGICYAEGMAPPSLPEYVIVDFPAYTGHLFFDGEGREHWFARFLAVRNSAVFKSRMVFEQRMDELHEATLRRLGITPQQEVEAHIAHLRGQRAKANLVVTEADIADMRAMLGLRGVRPIPDDVLEFIAKMSGAAKPVRQADVFKLFRAGQRVNFGATTGQLRKVGDDAGAVGQGQTALLQTRDSVLQMIATGDATHFGAPHNKFLHRLAPGAVVVLQDGSQGKQLRMGFGVEESLKQLRACGGSFQRAALALTGDTSSDAAAPRRGDSAPERDHVVAVLVGMGYSAERAAEAWRDGEGVEKVLRRLCPAAFGKETRSRLASRRLVEPPRFRNLAYVDVGMPADGTSMACLWLSVVAALSRLAPPRIQNAAAEAIVGDLAAVAQLAPAALYSAARPAGGGDAVGIAALRLRKMICGLMAEPGGVALYLDSFAAMHPDDHAVVS
eukprot:gene7192-15539_t